MKKEVDNGVCPSCSCSCESCGCNCKNPAYCGYKLLKIAFVLVPLIAGLDKFFNLLTVWGQYLSPSLAFFGNRTMMVVGVIEIIAGIGVWLKPRVFSYVVAIWLLVIILNLLLLGHYFDIALRDFGLLLAALSLGSLSKLYSNERYSNERYSKERYSKEK